MSDTPGETMLGGLPERADDAVGVEAGAEAEDPEESPRTVERVSAAGVATRGEFRGHHAVLCRAPTCSGLVMVPKFRRMPELMLEAMASALRQRVAHSAQQLRGAGHRAERAEGARRVEAVLVVVGMDRFGHLAFDLEADEKRFEELRARDAEPFADREARRQRRNRRMRQQPEDAIGRRRELRVVEVQRVAGRAVDQRRRRGARATGFAAEDRRTVLARRSMRRMIGPQDGAASVVDPARMTPRPSIAHRLPRPIASAGIPSLAVPTMKSTTAAVTRV